MVSKTLLYESIRINVHSSKMNGGKRKRTGMQETPERAREDEITRVCSKQPEGDLKNDEERRKGRRKGEGGKDMASWGAKKKE